MYFATYNGPNHLPWDLETVERFDSIADAKRALKARTGGSRGTDNIREYRRNQDGLYVPWLTTCMDFLGCEEDYITLYLAIREGGWQWDICSEPSYRLTLGERGGVIAERY